ncbi:hypothetical protein MKW94_008034 [Papaver nudicaule]|uniref:Uncharacterized protein n=1 Tax=Papaver nudicaule TaxID=74823 RepID=A0AA41V241_PAPNU|nr:hypothetical protein [Papaver nudicaule]
MASDILDFFLERKERVRNCSNGIVTFCKGIHHLRMRVVYYSKCIKTFCKGRLIQLKNFGKNRDGLEEAS